jgi:hypothetical protein
MSERWGRPRPEAGGGLIIEKVRVREAPAELCEVGA